MDPCFVVITASGLRDRAARAVPCCAVGVALLIGVSCCFDSLAPVASGQQTFAPPPTGRGGRPAGRPPGAAISPAMPGAGSRPGMMGRPPTGPRAQMPGGRNKPAATVPKEPVQFKEIDSVSLPPGYIPPAAPLDVMLIDKPIATPEELEKLKRERSKFSSALTKGESRDDATKQLIHGGIRYQLAQMTLKENRRDLLKYRDELMLRQLPLAGRLLDKADAVREFRRMVVADTMLQLVELLDNNFYVRLEATYMLGQLNLTEANPKIPLAEEAYTPAVEPLSGIIADPNQPEAVKIVAAQGLIRMFTQGSPNVLQKQAMGKAVIAALQSGQGHAWYQMRLAQALGRLDVELDFTQKPWVVDCLTAVIQDASRDLSVRAEAARSLGRVPLAASVDPATLPRPIAACALDLAKASSQKPGDRRWRAVALNLYLAFQAENANERDATKRNKAGLNNHPVAGAAASQVYKELLPVLVPLIKGQNVTQDQIQSLEAWVQKNGNSGAVAETAMP